MRRFSPHELQALLSSTNDRPLLLDVRETWEFDTCRIEGSTLIPMSRISHTYEQLDKDRETVVICHHGIRSRAVGLFLERFGFTDVINLEGGVERWAQDIDPAMRRY